MLDKLLHRWIGTALSSVTLALGCNHVHHDCDCCTTSYPVRVAVLPPAPAPAVVAAPVAPARLPEPEIKKEVPPPANVSVTCAQSASPGGTIGSVTGTLELTTADAEAMGIRPGYTPGALFMPPEQANVIAHSKDGKSGQPGEDTEKSNSTGSATENH